MTRRLFYILIIITSFNLKGFSQDDTWTKSNITDEMTLNPEQNKNWRMGQNKYSAKPKNAWELGVHFGHFFIDGDVDRTIPGGYGLGLHLRKAIHYVFSLRGDFFYGVAKGIDPQSWSHQNLGGGLVEGLYDKYSNLPSGWHPSHRTQYGYLSMQAVINIGNLLFHKERNKWNWYTALGVGLSSHKASLDLYDASGNAYDVSGITGDFDTKAGRKDIVNQIKDIYDGKYETEGYKKKGIFRIGDKTNVHAVFVASMGISRKINKRFNIGIEHQVIASDNDYLDGIQFRTALDQTNNVDISHYTNVRLGINLGNFNKVTEPLYWLNPLDAGMNDIADLKQRPVLDLTDTDADGIIDMLDQEVNTPAGAPVDTRGIALDSDGDNIADYKDKEPYSPPGYVVNSDGVADVKCCINMEDVNKAIDVKVNAKGKSDCGKWFLPMIHFDLDRDKIKPEFYGHLHHVANVLKMCPDVCVAVVGHTDVRSSNNYNQGLSYRRSENVVNYLVSTYGIDRSRFKLMYGGEEMLLAPGQREKEHYMNRRVEFRVCGPDDAEMAAPAVGSSSMEKSSSTKSTKTSKFIGNKNSGY
ncbi:MAG: OmpA family protein [Saprospiraceae bacterium]|nr:OmpA family protein [Saprospiraceae bacterium]MBK8371405.1 OmpA family protein [Saprospiraceae bacterium]MBK8548671.1 OmpA family protein [Saprospiraceae bacterium]MBK8853747.1 OmpA family protein [Saprospiraceae bacterium]MBK9041675.1 OmpA family protein [Saprospiraceae bacterium]